MGVENRKSPRIPLDVKVNYSKSAIARSKNISEDGICLISEEELKIGDYLNLIIYLSETQEIKLIGKVMWSKKVSDNYFEGGIQFWDIEDQEKKTILDYFSKQI